MADDVYRPVKSVCMYCHSTVVTYVEEEMNPFFFLITLLTVIVFGLLSFVLVPLMYMTTKTAVHRCSRCLQKIGEKKCYGLPTSYRDEVCSLLLDHSMLLGMAIQTRKVLDSHGKALRTDNDHLHGNRITFLCHLWRNVSLKRSHLVTIYATPGIKRDITNMERLLRRLWRKSHRRELPTCEVSL